MKRTIGAARILAVAGAALGALLLGAIFTGVSVPLFHLPTPTGAFAVGTIVSTLAGTGVQIWYPAVSPSGRTAPYRFALPPRRLRDRFYGTFVRTDAALGAPVAPGRHPALVYIPSWGGVRSDNTTQAENLASHGYVVVAIDDLYPDKAMDLSTAVAYRDTLRWAARKVRLEAAVALRVLSALESGAGDAGTRFAGRLDRDNSKQIEDGFARYGGYDLTVTGVEHYNFSDVGVLPSLRHTGVGPLEGRRASAIVAAYVLQFFDRYVCDRPAPLFDELTAPGADRSRISLDPAARLEIRHPRKSAQSNHRAQRSAARFDRLRNAA